MRRIYIFPLLLLMSLTAVFIVAAQEDPLPNPPTPVSPITGNNFMNLNGSPFSINAAAGSDYCSSATQLTFSGDGSQMDVADKTQSSSDPDLSCMWGNPTSSKGYRTVWYKFTASANGIMSITTLPASSSATNAYDTVLAVHEVMPHPVEDSDCDYLTLAACNDDTMGFSSAVTMNVKRQTTYYIEVADWDVGGNGIKTLDLSMQIDPYDTLWETQSGQPNTLTARQASVVIGSDVYLIGGRGASGSLVRDLQKLDTNTGQWTNLPSMPGSGVLNTTAVYLPPEDGRNGRIYVPGGSIQANDQAYTRQHWYYDLGAGYWDTSLSDVGGTITPIPFAYAAAAPNRANDEYFLTGGVIGPGYPITTTSTVTNQVLLYKPATDDWYQRAPMNSPRYGHVAATIGNKICVAGGINIDGGTKILVSNGECASSTSPIGWTNTEDMKVPRYFAHSSVAPNGNWVVYGGIDGNGLVVPEVEVYDLATNSWSVLGVLHDVGGYNGQAIVRPGGGFVGNYLWLAGGSFDATGNNLNPQVAELETLLNRVYIPIVAGDRIFGQNHSFEDAWPLWVNASISQNFASSRELVNVYSFDVNQLQTVKVTLTSVASDANINLYVFGDNKDLYASETSPFPGIDKTIEIPLSSGRYYVVVRYLYSTNQNDFNDYYQLTISG